MRDLKAAFFDLDDTLCDDAAAWVGCSHAAALIAQHRIGVNADKLAEAFLIRSEAYWMSLEPVTETRPLLEIRTSQWADALHEVAGAVDLALAEELGDEYGTRRSREIKLFPDAVATLQTLRENGIMLALITNGVQLTHVEKIQYLGLEPLFDHILIADAIGYFKPDPRIYQEACRLCHVLPKQAVMVGDHLKNDIGGAQAAGLSAYWFNPNGLSRQPSDPFPDGEVKTLGELIDQLEPRLP